MDNCHIPQHYVATLLTPINTHINYVSAILRFKIEYAQHQYKTYLNTPSALLQNQRSKPITIQTNINHVPARYLNSNLNKPIHLRLIEYYLYNISNIKSREDYILLNIFNTLDTHYYNSIQTLLNHEVYN